MAPHLYEMPDDARSDIHWDCLKLKAEGSTDALTLEGEGVINRFWCTWIPEDRETDNAVGREVVVNLYWDGSETPAVSVPLADFFCQPLQLQAIENHCFTASSRYCVFNSLIPMPFRWGARLELVNGTGKEMLFWYGFDVERIPVSDAALYMHAYWHSREGVPPREEMTVLPTVHGRGRYLGTTWALRQTNVQKGWPWYDRQVRVFVDDAGKERAPSVLIGSLDDFICSAWWSREAEHEAYAYRYTGRPLVQTDEAGNLSVVFYRYHVPDPIWFHQSMCLELGDGSAKADRGDWRTTAFFYLDSPTCHLSDGGARVE